MESFESPQSQLAAARRAEAAPWIDYPSTPWWYYPAGGVWAALLTATTALGSQPGHRWTIGVQLVLVAVVLAFVVWMRKHRGTMPRVGLRKGTAPSEMWRVMSVGVAVFLLTAVVVALVTALVHVVAGVIAALVLVPLVLVWYERAYAGAAEAVRTRLDGASM